MEREVVNNISDPSTETLPSDIIMAFNYQTKIKDWVRLKRIADNLLTEHDLTEPADSSVSESSNNK
jgi:hypothetical protein